MTLLTIVSIMAAIRETGRSYRARLSYAHARWLEERQAERHARRSCRRRGRRRQQAGEAPTGRGDTQPHVN
jgi:hypothetical protein